MSQKVTVIGVSHGFGTSKKDGKEYDICNAHMLYPMESFKSDTWQAEQFGHESISKNISLDIFNSLSSLSFPLVCNLKTESDLRTGRLKIVSLVPVL